MRRILIVFWLLMPTIAASSENLIENLIVGSNVTISDGVIYQDTPKSWGSWKCLFVYGNQKHPILNGNNTSQEAVFYFWEAPKIGFMSYTFTTPDDLEDLIYIRFGMNGSQLDTIVTFDIKDVMPNTTYTLQWRVLNTTPGEIAWTDMRVVRCTDGYALELGDENCSQECINKSVTGGYIPPDIARVYEPEICAYQQSELVCDDGYARLENECAQMCTAGITHLYAGSAINGLYANKTGTPVLCVRYKDKTCYGHLSPGRGSGLNVNIDGAIYHLTD